MGSLLRLVAARRLLAAVLLAAAVVGCAERGPPSSDELAQLSGPAVHDLGIKHHAGEDREICGRARIPDIEAVGVVPHGLTSTSGSPCGGRSR